MKLYHLLFFIIGPFVSLSVLAASLHDYKFTDIDGKERSFAEFKGKVLLLVNTASECGFTGQYEGLENLYKKYNEKGLEVIGFPSNQFGGQEPGTETDIKKFCKLRYGVSFTMGKKIDVNGENAADFYNYLKGIKVSDIDGNIKWNFEKFLINKQGVPVARFRSWNGPSNSTLIKNIQDLTSAP